MTDRNPINNYQLNRPGDGKRTKSSHRTNHREIRRNFKNFSRTEQGV